MSLDIGLLIEGLTDKERKTYLRAYYFVPLLLAALFGFTGCYSSPYLAERYHDFKDMGSATVGSGAGFKFRGGPLHGGLLVNRDWGGLRGGEWFQDSFGNQGPEERELFVWTEDSFNHGYFRGKDYDFVPFFIPLMGHGSGPDRSGLVPFVSLPPIRSDESSGVPPSYYTDCEFVFGLLGTVRLGFNPGEMLDWSLGWVGLDMFGDDYLTTAEYVSCSWATPEGLVKNAERIKGRIGEDDDFEGMNPLEIVTQRNRVDLARTLVKLGTKPRILPTASAEMVQAMVSLGCQFNADGSNPPLFDVIKSGNVDGLQAMVKLGAKVNSKLPGSPPLFYAATYDDPEVARRMSEILLAAGAKVNEPVEPCGYRRAKTILGSAVWVTGDTELVNALLAAGADPNQEDVLALALDAYGFFCGERDYAPVVKSLLAAGAKIKDTHLFIALNPNYRDPATIELLLKAGADPNALAPPHARGGTGNRPALIAALSCGGYNPGWFSFPTDHEKNITRTLAPTIELLLDHGADPSYSGVMREAREKLAGTRILATMESKLKEKSQ